MCSVYSVSRKNIMSSADSLDSNKQSVEDEVDKKAESDLLRALDETGVGRYNYKIIIVSGIICMNTAFAITNVSFIVPSAACDFNMDTIDKGRLSASPILGMLLGSCIWGCIADTKGRRAALLSCLLLQGVSDCVASVVLSYWGFIIFKFLSGIAVSGQIAILYTYVGEFQPESYREKALSLMEIPWVAGFILSPAIAWMTLPLDINLTFWCFSFKSWNLYAAMCSLPAYIASYFLLSLPETPKYLAEKARHEELQNVLTAMYRGNTRNTAEEYIEKLEKAGITLFNDRSNDPENIPTENRENILHVLAKFFVTLYEQTATLLRPPYVLRTLITCLDSYFIFSGLYTLMLWFPELFHRFAIFEEQHPGESASVCTISKSTSIFSKNNETWNTVNSSVPNEEMGINAIDSETFCENTIQTQVYVHTMILALSCIPAAVIFTACAGRLGFRFFLVFNSFCCCATTIGLLLVRTSTQNLILSCIYEALMSIATTTIFCISVEVFPTNLRVTGSALASLCGRIGALTGNTLFGYLIDDYCLVLISIVAIELMLAGILGIFITTDEDGKSKKHKASAEIPEVGLKHSKSDRYSPASGINE